MDIATHLLVGESISYAEREILTAIGHGRIPGKRNWYAITTAYEPCNLFYIMSGSEFRHPMYHRNTRPLRLIGLAGSRAEAFLLLETIVQQFADSDSVFEMKTALDVY